MSKVGIIDYEKLVDGTKLMYNNTNLTSVKCPFPALKNGTKMFEGCSFLKTFEVPDLSKLENGHMMFSVDNTNEEDTFTTFTVDLPMLKNGYYMFSRELSPYEIMHDTELKYPALKTFDCDISKLIDGRWMFFKSSLRNFLPTIKNKDNFKLNDLRCAYQMFNYSYLNLESYKTLSEVLPDIKEYMTKTNLENNDLWTYEVEGAKDGKIEILPEMRGRLGLKCRRLEDEQLKEVQQYLDTITGNGWLIDRSKGYLYNGSWKGEYNLPFYYSKSLTIEIKKFNGTKYESKLKGKFNFNAIRDQGSLVFFEPGYQLEINELPRYQASFGQGTITPLHGTGNEERCLDDGTSTGNIALDFDYLTNRHGISVNFKLSSVKSDLSVTYNGVIRTGSEKYKVLIEGVEKYSN